MPIPIIGQPRNPRQATGEVRPLSVPNSLKGTRTHRITYQDSPESTEKQIAQANKVMAHMIDRVLTDHYHGYWFYVKVEHAKHGGYAFISMPLLTGNNGYFIKLSDLHSDPSMKMVIRGAGHLLERLNLPRTPISRQNHLAAIDNRPLSHPSPNWIIDELRA